MISVTDDEVLNRFARQLKERLGDHFKQFILFGSRARGDNDPDSDYGCLVVVDEVTRKVEDAVDQLTGDTLYEHSVLFYVLPISAERYAEHEYDPLLMNVRKEGVAVNV